MFKKFNKPTFQYKLHATITVFWILTIIPTIVWWRNSVLWVAFLSIYANVISQWTCARAIKAEIQASKAVKVDKNIEKIEEQCK